MLGGVWWGAEGEVWRIIAGRLSDCIKVVCVVSWPKDWRLERGFGRIGA